MNDNSTAPRQPPSWVQRMILIVVVAGVLAVLAALAWPTIEKQLGLAAFNQSRFWVAINVGAIFSAIGFIVYFVAKKSLSSPAVLMAIGVVATLVLALVVVLVLARTGGAKAVSDNAAVIGALVALGGVFTAQMVSIALEDQRTHEARALEGRRTQEARDLEAQRAHEARDLEAQRTREAALQNYFEAVGKLLIETPLREASPGDNFSTVVRAQTLSVLEGLDPARKRILLLFLYESRLIDQERALLGESGLIERRHNILSLLLADLRHCNLSYAILSGAILSYSNLSEADLSEANLSGAVLDNANLSGAVLDNANLGGAEGITNEDLEQQDASLKGATMPNGQKYEDWLKDRGEEVENRGTS